MSDAPRTPIMAPMGRIPLQRGVAVACAMALTGGLTAGASADRDAANSAKQKTKVKGGKGKGKDKGAAATPGPATTAVPASPAAPASATAPAPTAVPAAPTAPEVGVAIAVAPIAGTIVVRTTPDAPAVPITQLSVVPAGAHVDARHGTVRLVAAIDAQGHTQAASFRGGVFAVRQVAGGGGMTRIVLVGGSFAGCRATAARPALAQARAAAKRRPPIRRLWAADHHGRFQTSGRGSVATVRGTRWLTEDSCDGTTTRVGAGAVSVYDRGRHRSVVVRAGQAYLASVR